MSRYALLLVLALTLAAFASAADEAVSAEAEVPLRLVHPKGKPTYDYSKPGYSCHGQPDFCKPYSNDYWAQAVYTQAKPKLYAAMLALGGTSVANLWADYIDGRYGVDTPTVKHFKGSSDPVVKGFAEATESKDDANSFVRETLSALKTCQFMTALGEIRAGRTANINVADILRAKSNLKDRHINWSTITSIPGNIAGGRGSTDTHRDYRHIVGGSISYTKAGNSIRATGTIKYKVQDGLDFCPGDCGARLEQLLTIELSRLEASGFALDKVYTVEFSVTDASATLNDAIRQLQTSCPPGAGANNTPGSTPEAAPEERTAERVRNILRR